MTIHYTNILEIYNVKCVLHGHVSKMYSNSDDNRILHVY
jgi:hypothetical protein